MADKLLELYEQRPGYEPTIWENGAMKTKYIIVDIDGKQVPIIFGGEISHRAAFRGVQHGLRLDAREDNKSWPNVLPVSAGFADGLSVTRVHGYSESMRYGFDHIPKDYQHTTEAHPETDLPLINKAGVRSPAATPQPANGSLAGERDHVSRILQKRDANTRHLSSAQRAAIAKTTIESREVLMADVRDLGMTVNAYIDLMRKRTVI